MSRLREGRGSLFAAVTTRRRVGGSPAPASVVVTLPPVSWEVSSEAARDGMIGSTLAGRYWLLGSTHYVYVVHDGQNVDPAVAGRTGIAVELGSGNHTGTQHATAAASAITSAGFDVEQDGDTLTITGASTAEDGSVGWADAGTHSMFGMQHESGGGLTNGSNVGTFRVSYLADGVLPTSGVLRVNGIRVRRGTSSTGQMQFAIYQGGTRGTPSSSLVYRGRVGATTGSTTGDYVYLVAESPILIDLSQGPIAIGWMGDGTGTDIGVVSTNAQAASAASDWHNGSANAAGIWVMTGGPTGSSGTFPDSFDAEFTTFNFVPFIGIIGEIGPFQTSTTWRRLVGTPHNAVFSGAGSSTSNATLLVANSYTMPNILGMELDSFSVNYATHVLGQDYRAAWAEGGSAANDLSGATFQDIGQTSGTATGWSDIAIATNRHISVTASARAWLTIRCNFANASGSSELSFETTTGLNQFNRAANPARYYGGNTTESEYFPPGGTDNIDFDPTVPLVGVIEPNGTNTNNNNNVGVRARLRVPGVSVA